VIDDDLMHLPIRTIKMTGKEKRGATQIAIPAKTPDRALPRIPWHTTESSKTKIHPKNASAKTDSSKAPNRVAKIMGGMRARTPQTIILQRPQPSVRTRHHKAPATIIPTHTPANPAP
jgi:hypothetical protein